MWELTTLPSSPPPTARLGGRYPIPHPTRPLWRLVLGTYGASTFAPNIDDQSTPLLPAAAFTTDNYFTVSHRH